MEHHPVTHRLGRHCDTSVEEERCLTGTTLPPRRGNAQVLRLAEMFCTDDEADYSPPEHRAMIGFYTRYWRANRDVLLDGEFRPSGPMAGATEEMEGSGR